MRKLIYILIVIAAAALLWEAAGPKHPAIAPTVRENGQEATSTPDVVQSGYFGERSTSSLGNYLTNKNGFALYTFSNDTPGVSNCTSTCLDKWPPYGPGIKAEGTTTVNLPMLPQNAGTMKGNNGMIQFTWKGMPLYYYFKDSEPGSVLGEGLLNSWYVVKL